MDYGIHFNVLIELIFDKCVCILFIYLFQLVPKCITMKKIMAFKLLRIIINI